jgi:hypothetical protein
MSTPALNNKLRFSTSLAVRPSRRWHHTWIEKTERVAEPVKPQIHAADPPNDRIDLMNERAAKHASSMPRRVHKVLIEKFGAPIEKSDGGQKQSCPFARISKSANTNGASPTIGRFLHGRRR